MYITSKFAVAALIAASYISLGSLSVFACSRSSPFTFEELFVADAVVTATADKYVGTPNLSTRTTGVASVQVEFTIDETLRGKAIESPLILNGYLGEKDDLNEQPVPYVFVRQNGRSGACFANTYKRNAKFLLFLTKTKDGYSSNISALGPSNEQLNGADDLWLEWVRSELVKRTKN